MSISSEDVNAIAGGGGEVRTADGEKIGNVGQVYVDDDSGQPSWVSVKTGLFGTQESFVPLAQARLAGTDVVVPYDKDTIKGAPRVDSGGSLTPSEEKRLYAYYLDARSLDTGGDRDDLRDDDVEGGSRVPSSANEPLDSGRSDDDQPGRSGVEDDRSDDAVGSPRLRKYVVTEKVVPVSREEVAVDDSDRG